MDLLFASLVLASHASERGAAVLGERVGKALALATPTPVDAGAPDAQASEPLREPARVAALGAAGSPAPPRGAAPRQAPSAERRPRRGVYVPASAVLAFARRGVVPGINAVDAQGRPAGVRLRGVSSAGVGLQDGDRLVAVGRAPVRNLADVTGIVSSALMAGHTQMSGTVLRGDEELEVLVELPGVEDAGAP